MSLGYLHVSRGGPKVASKDLEKARICCINSRPSPDFSQIRFLEVAPPSTSQSSIPHHPNIRQIRVTEALDGVASDASGLEQRCDLQLAGVQVRLAV